MNNSRSGRALLEKTLGVHREAPVPEYHSRSAQKRLRSRRDADGNGATAANGTRGRVLVYVTCYGNRNLPSMVEDLVAVLEHNGIPVAVAKGRGVLRNAET